MSFFLSLFRTTLQQRLRRVRSWVILFLIPCLIVVVWGLLFIIGANFLEPFIILG